MLAYLCKGRNKHSIRLVQNLGITEAHIIDVIKNQFIDISIKSSYLMLYEMLHIDIEPFLSLGWA
jgi:hypothetical protein